MSIIKFTQCPTEHDNICLKPYILKEKHQHINRKNAITHNLGL